MGELATLVPAAHAGHWMLSLGPVLIVLVVVLISAVRERRARDAAEPRDRPDPD